MDDDEDELDTEVAEITLNDDLDNDMMMETICQDQFQLQLCEDLVRGALVAPPLLHACSLLLYKLFLICPPDSPPQTTKPAVQEDSGH